MSCVVIAVRLATLCFAALALLAGTARAGDQDDPPFAPLRALQLAAGFTAYATPVNGTSEGGAGPALELALGHQRFQAFAAATLATAATEDLTDSPLGRTLHGWLGTAVIGTRWVARQYQPDATFGVELLLEAAAGAQRFWWRDGTRLTRPELELGLALQMRGLDRLHYAVRLDARVVLAPAGSGATGTACRGGCAMTSSSDAGFATGLELAW